VDSRLRGNDGVGGVVGGYLDVSEHVPPRGWGVLFVHLHRWGLTGIMVGLWCCGVFVALSLGLIGR
jgi:hypothetical protein